MSIFCVFCIIVMLILNLLIYYKLYKIVFLLRSFQLQTPVYALAILTNHVEASHVRAQQRPPPVQSGWRRNANVTQSSYDWSTVWESVGQSDATTTRSLCLLPSLRPRGKDCE